MKKDETDLAESDEIRNKEITAKLARLSIDRNVFEGSTDLPQVFQVIYF